MCKYNNNIMIMGIATQLIVLMLSVWLMLAQLALSDEIEIPSIDCPHYFRYQPRGSGYIGKITLDNVPNSTLDLEVTFSQRQPIVTSFRGRLAFEHDLITVQKDFEAGNPIVFIVNFPLATEIPKLIDIKMNGENICSGNIPENYTETYTFRRSFTPTTGTHRISKMASSSTTTTEKPAPETADSTLCGLTSFNEANVLLGEHNVTWGWFPWAAKIYRQPKLKYGLTYTATGALISTRIVITVITSLKADDTADEIVVQLGVLGLIDVIDSYPVSRRVVSLLRHPEYGQKTYSDADIALLKLDRPVSFNRYILPVCLWSEAEETDKIVGENGYVAYFSSSGFDKVINTTIIKQAQCLQSDKAYIKTISSRTFCVDYHNKSGPYYNANGGSSLILNRKGQWTLRGLYSACIIVNETCDTSLYFVYTDVAKFSSWIRDNIRL